MSKLADKYYVCQTEHNYYITNNIKQAYLTIIALTRKFPNLHNQLIYLRV